MSSGIRRNICGTLLAQETVFGWILTWPIINKSISSFSDTISLGDEKSLEKAISRFYEVEEPPKKAIRSDDDRYCEDYFKKTTTRNADGRYVISLPFKKEFV